jgi:hypothetical protein
MWSEKLAEQAARNAAALGPHLVPFKRCDEASKVLPYRSGYHVGANRLLGRRVFGRKPAESIPQTAQQGRRAPRPPERYVLHPALCSGARLDRPRVRPRWIGAERCRGMGEIADDGGSGWKSLVNQTGYRMSPSDRNTGRASSFGQLSPLCLRSSVRTARQPIGQRSPIWG